VVVVAGYKGQRIAICARVPLRYVHILSPLGVRPVGLAVGRPAHVSVAAQRVAHLHVTDGHAAPGSASAASGATALGQGQGSGIALDLLLVLRGFEVWRRSKEVGTVAMKASRAILIVWMESIVKSSCLVG
jgi:hypothetical protein